jgi:hypothetical protein
MDWIQPIINRYPPQALRQHPHHRQTIRAAGNSDHNSITVLQHVIVVHGFAESAL